MVEMIGANVSVREALAWMAARLRTDSAALDAQVALAHILARPRTWLAAHPEAVLTDSQLTAAETALARLEVGEPLPYVLGRWEFYGLEFELSPDVLIPRPETELLVEQALAFLDARPEIHRVADIGTGCGAIAVSIAVNSPNVHVLATDVSSAALAVGRTNASKHAVEQRIAFVECDILPRSGGRFDLLCANLPYIPSANLRGLEVFQREPALALDGGLDGLDVVRRMLSRAAECLNPRGLILAEIEASQGRAAADAASAVFPTARISVHPDLAGLDRVLEVAA